MVAWPGPLLLAVALAPGLLAQDRGGFASALAEVRAAVDTGDLRKAESLFRGLLATHGDTQVARNARESLIEEARRIAFRRAYQRPSLHDVLVGELRGWDPGTKRLEIRYRSDQLDDFRQQEGGGFLHPLAFSGPYQVTVRGRAYSGVGPRLFVGVVAGLGYEVVIGHPADAENNHVPAHVALLTEGEAETLVSTDRSPALPGEPFVISVRVGDRSIDVSFNGRTVCTAPKRSDDPGQVGFLDVAFDSITLAGEAPAAWLESRLVQHRERARSEFGYHYDPTADLPASVFVGPPLAEPEVSASYPGGLLAEHLTHYDDCMELLGRGDFVALARRLAETGDHQLPEQVRTYVRALAYIRRGELLAALADLGTVLRESPYFLRGRVLRSSIRIRLGQRDEGIAELEKMWKEHPRCLEVVELLARLHQRDGKHDRVAELLADARCRGLESDVLQEVRWTAVKSERGPDWEQRYEYRSRHYQVISDIDRRTCLDVGAALEEAYAVFEAELGRATGARSRLQVLVFGGEESYRSYYRGVLGDIRIHTTGLYSPALKQLLVWHVADHRRTLRTVRHEGLHQYLDAAMPDPPLWFNEGLAEFYTAERRGVGRYTGGAMRAMHLRTLRQRRARPLRSFLVQTPAEFYADADLGYAQSWAFIHFLRERSQRHKVLFRRLFAAFVAGQGPGDAVVSVFGEDLERIEAEFLAYLREIVPTR